MDSNSETLSVGQEAGGELDQVSSVKPSGDRVGEDERQSGSHADPLFNIPKTGEQFSQIDHVMLRNPELSAHQRIVFAVIASLPPANVPNLRFASYSILSNILKLSPKTIRKHIGQLARKGLLTFEPGNRFQKKATEYTLNPPRNWRINSRDAFREAAKTTYHKEVALLSAPSPSLAVVNKESGANCG